MEDIDLRDAEGHLSELVGRAARGESIRITDPKHGAVRLVADAPEGASKPPYPARIFGQWKHLAEIPDERLFAPLTDDELEWLSGEKSGSD